MRKNSVLVISLAFFSLITGHLLSSISFVGRAGISLFYTQYQFLKNWWKGSLLVFIVWVALFIIQNFLYKKIAGSTSNIIQTALLLIGIAGILFSYSDFRHTLSHRWLGERFHLGVYLFWLGWIAITIFSALQKKTLTTNIPQVPAENSYKKAD